ncbi:MAG: BON domain-containing protein [Hydrogenophaga sp.]|uniref:BON domain-containing protein n=1 Tax=Hydrogenophaga sp. TaxID=1904254 RepID=UPI0025B9D21B|nr:BON domain-containing protein [Hydrogenophaga sp.]MBT9549830.1 BON domain-containing protein [Hydrogenophaga sp.]
MSTHTPFSLPRTALAALAVAALTGLGACAQTAPAPSPTVGQRVDSAIEKSKEVATEVKDNAVNAVNTVSAKSSDVAITTRVKAALAADSELSALAINVDTTDAVVSLYGPAPSAEAINRATTLAKAVTGVVDVKNNLTLVKKP